MSDQADRPMRSVFVGNIPYEVTEEQLKGIFSEVGPVQSLKLVYDRETGKPKGYGFCEYKDVETALVAMRNLNGYEINGRTLRVDNAGAERHRMAEIGQNGPRHADNENSYGYGEDGPVPPEKAPEVIARTVASLPPEQMFELMKQMKLCIQNNPNEARTMLLQNPQLAYALLQALVVMKIVDPSIALGMLHKDSSVPVGALMPEGQMAMMPGAMPGPPSQTDNPWITSAPNPNAPLMPMNPPGPFGTGVMPPHVPVQSGDMDLRQLDPRLRGPVPSKDFDLRDPRAQDRYIGDPRRERVADRDLRDPRGFPSGSGQSSSVPPVSDPRQRRDGGMPPGSNPTAGRPSAAPPLSLSGFRDGATDAEKASLIMQVMSISDEQLAQLPPEQRQSIMVLKESIAKSTSQKR